MVNEGVYFFTTALIVIHFFGASSCFGIKKNFNPLKSAIITVLLHPFVSM